MLANAQVAVPSNAAAIRLSFQLDVQVGGAVINVLNAETGSSLAQVTDPGPGRRSRFRSHYRSRGLKRCKYKSVHTTGQVQRGLALRFPI